MRAIVARIDAVAFRGAFCRYPNPLTWMAGTQASEATPSSTATPGHDVWASSAR